MIMLNMKTTDQGCYQCICTQPMHARKLIGKFRKLADRGCLYTAALQDRARNETHLHVIRGQ